MLTMADPLSISGLILQVITTAKTVYDYASQVKNAQKDIRELFGELFALKAIVDQIQMEKDATIKVTEIYFNNTRSSDAFDKAMTDTRNLLQEILDDLVERALRGQSLLRNLGWPGKKTNLQEKVAKLERIKTYFILVLMNDKAELGRDMSISIGAIAETSIQLYQNNQDEINRKIKDWICPIDLELMHRRARSTCQSGTGLWFIDGPFQRWLSGSDDMRLLYLEGKSGSGKTVLCSSAIEAVQTVPTDKTSFQVLYHYCSFRSVPSQQLIYILGALITQISETIPSILEDLREPYERRTEPTADALIEIIHSHIDTRQHLLVFIDAVNESSESDAIFKALHKLMKLLPNLFAFTTSTVPPPSLFENNTLLRVKMETSSNPNDIHAYINRQLEQQPALHRLAPHVKDQIKRTLTKKANGMFRYVQCQLELLSSQRTGRDVIRALEQIPDGINGTYELILECIPPSDRELAREILVWLIYNRQPIRLSALNEAIVLQRYDRYLDDECKLFDQTAILHICQGLLTYDEKTSIVALAHSSVRSYLTSDAIKKSRAAFYSVDERVATRNIFQKCLTYLMFDEFNNPCRNIPALNKRLAEYPLLRYAAENWATHCNAIQYTGDGLIDSDLEQAMSFFYTHKFHNGGNYTSWAQILLFEAPAKLSFITEPLYYAASFGLLPVVDRLLENGASRNCHGGRNKSTPLVVATFRGHLPVVKLLLERGEDPNTKDIYGMTSLEWALEKRFHEIEHTLRQYGAGNTSPNPDIHQTWMLTKELK
ncbi:hypothetical protein BGW36DRAFT_84581 [Talaromyces proteolyticus]|uniref:NACHT domain-containing protein n=1 Tax=Talaromyces proteolyticus TaxID=1131652 RepID=A0AAD4Q4M4_9EURO|nr:uncharacterized protein BGW36DRAFT_84581 [Talaromyces proteolyticus]KAH8703264.1 hypothetical protein BGW36DRAFT_84581 [Talaromyces proteolyticus]